MGLATRFEQRITVTGGNSTILLIPEDAGELTIHLAVVADTGLVESSYSNPTDYQTTPYWSAWPAGASATPVEHTISQPPTALRFTAGAGGAATFDVQGASTRVKSGTRV